MLNSVDMFRSGSWHSGGSGGAQEAGGSDVGSGVSNTPKASQDFNWAMGLDLPPHEEEDPLFAGMQVRMCCLPSRNARACAHSDSSTHLLRHH